MVGSVGGEEWAKGGCVGEVLHMGASVGVETTISADFFPCFAGKETRLIKKPGMDFTA